MRWFQLKKRLLSSLEDGEEEDLDDLAEGQDEEYEVAKEIVSADGSRFSRRPTNSSFMSTG